MKRVCTESLKFKRFVRKFSLPEYQAIGLLEAVWHLAARETPRGDIGRLSNEDIALGIGWTDEPQALVDMLVEGKWLDRSDEHRLIVHDIHEHADEALRKLVARRGGFLSETNCPNLKDARRHLTDDVATMSGCTEMVSGDVSTCQNIVPRAPEPEPEPEPEETITSESDCKEPLSPPGVGGSKGKPRSRAWFDDVLDSSIAYLNLVTGSKFRPESSDSQKLVARIRPLKHPADREQIATAIRCMIDFKFAEWGSDSKMAQYLRPATLFQPTKFESYIGAARRWDADGRPPISSKASPPNESDWGLGE